MLNKDNMNTYEIYIGESRDLLGNKSPRLVISITQEQYDIIKTFASTRKDENLNTIYKLNECEFYVHPQFYTEGDNDDSLKEDLSEGEGGC